MTNFTFVGLSENLTSSYDCLSYNAWSNAFYVTDGGEALQFHSSFPALYMAIELVLFYQMLGDYDDNRYFSEYWECLSPDSY